MLAVGCHVAPGLNAHFDYDECPCAGPFMLTGLSGRENFGIVVADSDDAAVSCGQDRNAEVFFAVALDPQDLGGGV